MLIRYPHTVMVNKENYYQEYKGHIKWLSLISSHFAKKNFFFGMTLLHAHTHYICIVCAKYQKASVKALVQVDFLMYALSQHKPNPYLIEKMDKFTKLSFCQKLNILASNIKEKPTCHGKRITKGFFTQMINVFILCKQGIRLFQQKLWYNQVDFPAYALSINKMH